MTRVGLTVAYLPGAGGGAPDWSTFRANDGEAFRFELIAYPGWQRYVKEDFSADVLIAELAAEVAARAPDGAIHLIGASLGGHLGYAVALRLQQMGREIGGFCALDSFMISSASLREGWRGRIVEEVTRLLREGRFRELSGYVQALCWRGMFRLLGDRIPRMLQRFGFASRASKGSAVSALDRNAERELSMRLLLQATAPWIRALNANPVPLLAPAILLRTRSSATDDSAWRRRCPKMEIIEIAGNHSTFLEPANAQGFREKFSEATREWRGPVPQERHWSAPVAPDRELVEL